MQLLPSLTACVVYGTDSGNTEFAARQVATGLRARGFDVRCLDIGHASLARLHAQDLVIFGIPTGSLGKVQTDYAERESELRRLRLECPVALFGLGDQLGYGDYFVDALGWLREVISAAGATLIGRWPTAGYQFASSRAVDASGDFFHGLALDEDQQFELSEARIDEWLDQLVHELVRALNQRGVAL